MHDLGLAAWFGGTLANAVSLNAAAAEATGPTDTGRVANVGWDRWTPVNAAAIGMHVLGSLAQLGGNARRVNAQEGVAQMVVLKTAVTAAALGATAYSRMLGAKVSQQTDVPAESGTEPCRSDPARRGGGSAPAGHAAVGGAGADRCARGHQLVRR
jgi:hypothetical protein